MLTRKCDVADFLRTEDRNLRITVVSKQEIMDGKRCSIRDPKWEELFRDSIGGGIIHDSQTTYYVLCQTQKETVNFTVKGSEILDTCWGYLNASDIVRLDLTKITNDLTKTWKNPHSWIVMRVDD